MQELINNIAQLKEYMIILILFVLLTYLLVYFSKKSKNVYIWKHFIIMLNTKAQVELISCYSFMCFTISCAFRFQSLNAVHVIFYIVQSILCLVFVDRLKMLIFVAVNTLLCAVALIVNNMIFQYMILMHTPTMFLVVYILTGICITMYSFYLFLYELYFLVNGGKKV